MRSRYEERKSAPQAKRFFGGRAVPVYLVITREAVNRPRRPQPSTKGLTGGLNRQPDGWGGASTRNPSTTLRAISVFFLPKFGAPCSPSGGWLRCRSRPASARDGWPPPRARARYSSPLRSLWRRRGWRRRCAKNLAAARAAPPCCPPSCVAPLDFSSFLFLCVCTL